MKGFKIDRPAKRIWFDKNTWQVYFFDGKVWRVHSEISRQILKAYHEELDELEH